MEHRQGTRISMGLPVAVSVGNTALGWFSTRDVGNGGLAINGDFDLPRNCVVDLVIEVQKTDRVVTERARAVVVHRQGGCTGFMWISRDIALQRLVPETVRRAAA